MNADLLDLVEFWEQKKGLERETLFAAVYDAILCAASKMIGPGRALRVAIDPKSGDIHVFAKLVVSERVDSECDQITIENARRVKANAVIGDEVEVEVTPADFSRTVTKYAKKALLDQIRRAERRYALN